MIRPTSAREARGKSKNTARPIPSSSLRPVNERVRGLIMVAFCDQLKHSLRYVNAQLSLLRVHPLGPVGMIEMQTAFARADDPHAMPFRKRDPVIAFATSAAIGISGHLRSRKLHLSSWQIPEKHLASLLQLSRVMPVGKGRGRSDPTPRVGSRPGSTGSLRCSLHLCHQNLLKCASRSSCWRLRDSMPTWGFAHPVAFESCYQTDLRGAVVHRCPALD